MRIVLLCGNQSNQHALAAKIASEFDLVGIAFESKKSKASYSLSYLFSKIIDRIFFYRIISSWKNMLKYYRNNFSCPPEIISEIFENINSNDVINFIQQLNPDLIMVSGTRLIKEDILNLQPSKGIINLHTGLSPYIRGGPNCTNWCISNNTIHLIGNTVMWIDKGIDSGNIITTEVLEFSGNESLNDIHINVMEHAHHLYIKTLHTIKGNYINCPSAKQSEITNGELFLNKMWNFKAKVKLVYNIISGNFKKSINSTEYNKKRKKLILIELPKK